jgi:xanthine dehydrogenase accessory factor
LIREVDLASGARSLFADREQGARVEREIDRVRIRIGAAQRLLLAGIPAWRTPAPSSPSVWALK